MRSELLFYPMLAHVVWMVFLYGLLTLFRAPSVWNIGIRNDGSNSWASFEPRVSVNLSNQFEWPVLFYVIGVLLMAGESAIDVKYLWLAWIFVAGRIVHSGVQILTSNIRLRGVIFTINFVAVLFMWFLYVMQLG